MGNIINECYQKSIELLLKNSTKYGILASGRTKRAKDRNYLSIFGRDASICALGAIASGNKKLLAQDRTGLRTLGAYQAPNGQIPNYVKPEIKAANFWSLGCIDATLWWLVAIKYCARQSGSGKFKNEFAKKSSLAIYWLKCQEHQQDGLVMQNEASDWADILPRSGKVLYSNALWYLVKKLYKVPGAEMTKRGFNLLFYPFDKKINFESAKRRYNKKTIMLMLKKQRPQNYYPSFVNYMFWGSDIDVYGNALAVIFNLAPRNFGRKIVSALLENSHSNTMPMPVMFNPVKENNKLWRPYMRNYNQNLPFQYHNGGIWPFAACFWAMALAKAGHKQEAVSELERVAKANSARNWQFNEWFHGRTGKPMGMAGQSWNAGAFLLAYHYLRGEIEI